MTRLRTERVRPCEEYAGELWVARARLDFEATDFSLLRELGSLAATGDGSVLAGADEFEFVSGGAELSAVAAVAFCDGLVGAAACD